MRFAKNESKCNGLEVPRQNLENYDEYNWYVNERKSAETFEATTGYGYDDPSERMTDEEAWLEMYDDYLEAMTPLYMENRTRWRCTNDFRRIQKNGLLRREKKTTKCK